MVTNARHLALRGGDHGGRGGSATSSATTTPPLAELDADADLLRGYPHD
jgi:hypothetical protein